MFAKISNCPGTRRKPWGYWRHASGGYVHRKSIIIIPSVGQCVVQLLASYCTSFITASVLSGII